MKNRKIVVKFANKKALRGRAKSPPVPPLADKLLQSSEKTEKTTEKRKNKSAGRQKSSAKQSKRKSPLCSAFGGQNSLQSSEKS